MDSLGVRQRPRGGNCRELRNRAVRGVYSLLTRASERRGNRRLFTGRRALRPLFASGYGRSMQKNRHCFGKRRKNYRVRRLRRRRRNLYGAFVYIPFKIGRECRLLHSRQSKRRVRNESCRNRRNKITRNSPYNHR